MQISAILFLSVSLFDQNAYYEALGQRIKEWETYNAGVMAEVKYIMASIMGPRKLQVGDCHALGHSS